MTRERALELALQTFVMVESGELGQRRARPALPSEHAGVIADAILAAVAEERAGMVTHATMVSQIDAAVLAEREACAKIPDGHDYAWVADQIRERGIPLKVGA